MRDVGEPVERVDGAGVDRARGADDQKRPEARRAVGGDGAAKIAHFHRAPLVGRNEAQMARAEPRKLHRLAHAIMRFARRIGDELARNRAEPVEPHILVAIGMVARDQQATGNWRSTCR